MVGLHLARSNKATQQSDGFQDAAARTVNQFLGMHGVPPSR
jgi:hypothetical protein